MAGFIDIHTHATGKSTPGAFFLRAVLLDGENPSRPAAPYSIGIHPWDAGRAQPEWLAALYEDDPNMIAIGEIGLDHRRQYEPYQKQAEWFERQIAVANDLKLPLVIHNVRAQGDILGILKRKAETPWIIHGFTGSCDSAARFTDAGGYLSFGTGLLDSDKAAQALRKSPPGRLFFETDESAIPIDEIYSYAALVLDIPIDDLKRRIEDNFRTIFPHVTL